MSAPSLNLLAARVLSGARAAGVMIATAESCTGGLVAAALTDIAGSSTVVERGFVTYSNEAKSELLGVPSSLIAEVGAVSSEVARAMAEGALAHSRAQIAVSITGIAGPAGGSAEKPVGLVWFGLACSGAPTRVERRVFAPGDRAFVRLRAVETALRLLLSAVGPRNLN